MNTINLLVLLAVLAAAVFCDLRVRKIPNPLILAGLALGFGLSMLPAGVGALDAAAGFGLGFGAFLPLYALHVLGAGDVKLMAVVGSFLGLDGTLGAMLMSLLAGGVLAIGYGLLLKRLGTILGNLRGMVFDACLSVLQGRAPQVSALTSPVKLPYSLAIASGVLIFVFIRYQYTGALA